MSKIRNRLKIVISLFVAFFVSTLASNTIFVAGTPYINEPFIAAVWGSPKTIFTNSSQYLSALFGGREVRDNYQTVAINTYTTNTATTKTFSQPRLPFANKPSQATNPEDLRVKGYTQVAQDVYSKTDVSAGSITFVIGKDAKFKEEVREIDGRRVTVFTPL